MGTLDEREITPDRWQRIEALYHDMLRRPEQERRAALVDACGGDVALQREVESLLRRAASATGFLATPAVDITPAVPPAAALAAGRRIGVFEIQGLLGAGGMGEVYRARDTRLGREVAIKILPGVFSNDPARTERFEREARVLASLNHPHIGAIYGLEDADTVTALVMELIEGEDLSRVIARAPSVDGALRIARQIAEALEAAHASGIIHRDLKPGNIKVRSDGTVKVLDFGLAKALSPESLDATMPPMVTDIGMIMGTPAYMSPEQARGEPADRQSDIWSFGVVLYELLTGTAPFARKTTAETLASVLGTEVDYARLPPNTPAAIRHLVRRCLERDRKRRLQHIGDARIEIDDALVSRPTADGVATTVPASRRTTRTVAGALVVALAATAGWWVARQRPSAPAAPLTRLSIPTPGPAASYPFGIRTVAVAPDGSRIAYALQNRLWIRPLSGDEEVFVDAPVLNPFFSPDGRWVGYFHGPGMTRLSKVPITGGLPIQIVPDAERPAGAAWGADGSIVYSSAGALYLVPEGNGAPRLLTKPDPARNERAYAWPQFLPAGNAVLFTLITDASIDAAQIALLDLHTRQTTIVIRGGTGARLTATGHLVYAADRGLKAVSFDPDSRRTIGDPVTVPRVALARASDNGAADFAVSDTGTLVFAGPDAPVAPPRTLLWVDRDGKETPIPLAPGRIFYPRISPDATRIAYDVTGANRDIWIFNLERPSSVRLTSGPTEDGIAVWSRQPSGPVFFSSNRAGTMDIYSQAADGSGPASAVFSAPGNQWAMALSRDGSRLLVIENYKDVSLLPVDAPSRMEPLLHSQSREWLAEVSPDGNWLAYESDEANNRMEIVLRPFPNVTASREVVSVAGGRYPFWSPSGRDELYYVDPAGAMMAVPIVTSPRLRIGQPRKLFTMDKPSEGVSGRPYDVSPTDGRFVVTKSTAAAATVNLSVTLNWFQELTK